MVFDCLLVVVYVFEVVVGGCRSFLPLVTTIDLGGGGYSLIWAIWGRAARQGLVFGLAVLSRVYNLTCLCPKQVKNLS